MRIKNFKEKEIKNWLSEGTDLTEIIYNKLEINSSIDHSKLYETVLNDLEKKGYEISYDDDGAENILFDTNIRQNIPAVTLFEEKKILLNENFPELAQYEALFHEYVHINVDDRLSEIENLLEDKEKLHNLENLVDITTYILTMPIEEMRQNLKKKNYKINHVLTEKYAYFEKCSVLQWMSIIMPFACHFAWVMIFKNLDENINYDNYYYDHENDPQYYDIDRVLKIPRSAAARAVKYEKYSAERASFIGRNEYQCYAYYEKTLSRDICNVGLKKTSIMYDRLLVIGWKIAAYNEMQKKALREQEKRKN